MLLRSLELGSSVSDVSDQDIEDSGEELSRTLLLTTELFAFSRLELVSTDGTGLSLEDIVDVEASCDGILFV